MPRNAVQLRIFCWLHQLRIISGALLIILSKSLSCKLEFVSSMFSASMVLRSPGYFVSLIAKALRAVGVAVS